MPRPFRLLPTLLCSAALTAAAPVAVAAPTPAEAELAERWLQLGQRMVGRPETARIAAALADAADRAFDANAAGAARLYRTAADLRLSLGQRDEAIAALNAYRKSEPTDQLAQVQSIDLQSGKLQSATARADYLTAVAGSGQVSAEVRSHAAFLLAGVQYEMGDDQAAAAAIDQALALSPLNAAALQARLDRVTRSGTAPQRVEALVGLLLADPMQYATVSRLAEELLRCGQGGVAIDLYGRFLPALDAAGYAAAPDDATNYAVQLALADRTKEAGDVLAAAITASPDDAGLRELKLLLARTAGDDAAFKTASGEARVSLLRVLDDLHARLSPDGVRLDPPALPDVKGDVAKLTTDVAHWTAEQRQRADGYLAALLDLAWHDSYYDRRVPEADVLDAIDTMAGKDGPAARRSRGWAALAAGKADEAETVLSAVAARDPLSQLGVLQLNLAKGQDHAALMAEAKALAEKLPTDVWPLVLRQSLKDLGPVTFRTADADAVAAAAAKLPRDALTFAGDPRGFYYMQAEPLAGSVGIGEPMLVRVTLQNVGTRPLVIGPGGALSQQVTLDATVRANSEQTFPAVAVAKLGGRLVLRPRDAVTATVRLDSPDLSNFAAATPQLASSIFVSAVTNPASRNNAIVPGPGGVRAQGRSLIDRPQQPFARPDVRDALAKQLADADAVRRRRAVSTLGAIAASFAAGTDEQKALAPQAFALLQRATQDADPGVRATAWQELATGQPDPARGEAVKAMLAGPDFDTRVVACLLTLGRPRAERATLLAGLLGDADPTLATLAASVAALPDPAAAK